MVRHAWQEGYAIGAFSAHNAETILAVLEAAEAERSPVMIQIGQRAINTLGLAPLKALVDAYLDRVSVPVCVHLDHSRRFEQTLEAVRCGFQSVMFDGSHLPFAENARITRAVAEVAHALKIGCEGEIGKIGGVEDEIDVADEEALITSCEEAARFVAATGVDYLAVSIGTAHGLYTRPPKLAFGRLAELRETVARPVVLHGGSGVPDAQIRQAIGLGVAKINVDTELRQAFTEGMAGVLAENPQEYALAVTLGRGREAMRQKVQEKIRLFGSQGRA